MILDRPAEDVLLTMLLQQPALTLDPQFSPELLTDERREVAGMVSRLKLDNSPHGYETLRAMGASEPALKVYRLLAEDDVAMESFPVMAAHLRKIASNREVAELCKRYHERIMKEDANSTDWLGDMGRDVMKIQDLAMGVSEGISGPRPGNDISFLVGILEKAIANRGEITGLTSGFSKLDSPLDGFAPTNLYYIGARPSVGKTSFLLNLIEHFLINGHRGMLFSLEMSRHQILQNLLHANSRTSRFDLRDNVSKFLLAKLQASITGPMRDWNWMIDDTASITIEMLSHRARKAHMEEKLEWLAVDYLQLMRGSRMNKNSSRQSEIGEISGGLKKLAKDLHIPVICLSQLNRQPQTLNHAAGKKMASRPRLDQLRESGDIEQDADAVLLLHRDQEGGGAEVDAILAKNRFGPVCDIPLSFDLQHGRFQERTHQ